MRQVWCFRLALLASVCAASLAAQSSVKVTGYMQPRFQAIGDSAAFLLRRARFAVEGQAQLSSTTGPYGTTTGGSSSKKKSAQSDTTAGKAGVDAFGAGDASRGNWTGTNPGVTRRPTGGLPGYGPGYTGAQGVPGGNGALGAGVEARRPAQTGDGGRR